MAEEEVSFPPIIAASCLPSRMPHCVRMNGEQNLFVKGRGEETFEYEKQIFEIQ
jgi:hypothetical protein